MAATINPPNDTKEVFKKCGTCSQTFAHLLNREYENRDQIHEKALDTLAGGIFREGHQCGMLWGAALACGAEAARRTEDEYEAQALALTAAKELVDSFQDHNHTIECREFTGVKMNKLSGLLSLMIETLVKGMNNNKCFIMAEEWTPKAMLAAEEGLRQVGDEKAPQYNCCSILAKTLGATKEEAIMLAGFAGGLGLSGKGCGALAAAIYMKTLQWLGKHPGKTAPMMRYSEVSKLINQFKKETNNKMRCAEICGRTFKSAGEHARYLETGGCVNLLRLLSNN